MNKNDKIKKCKHHGLTPYRYEKHENRYRCRKCLNEAVTKRRRVVKEKLVQFLGGCCELCGYAKCVAALEFHHINPKDKSFGIGENGCTKAYAKMLEEVKKCTLLCSNCHREVETGITKLPDDILSRIL